ncbi:MAG: class I SAM-dependent methyltransferase [Bacteroidales bacterium]|nr:class I SAM-dependent methyltransferase [Bacteroidales bacterium]
MKVNYKECPLCENPGIRYLFTCRDYLVSGESFEIFSCPQCSFEFTQNHPSEEELQEYYKSDNYLSHSDSGTSFTDKLYYITRKIMLGRKKSSLKIITGINSGRILDIGSGTGSFAGYMKKAGWDATGIEINEKAREYSVKKYGIKAFSPEMLESFPDNSFDCITMWHVLEHLYDPLKTLAEIRRLLKPERQALIALPNSLSYDSLHYGRFWAARDVPRHLWHFNSISFTFIASKAGFEVTKVKRLPADVFYISYLSEKNKGSRLPFIKGIFKAIAFSFLSLFDKYKSSSLIYVIRATNK